MSAAVRDEEVEEVEEIFQVLRVKELQCLKLAFYGGEGEISCAEGGGGGANLLVTQAVKSRAA